MIKLISYFPHPPYLIHPQSYHFLLPQTKNGGIFLDSSLPPTPQTNPWFYFQSTSRIHPCYHNSTNYHPDWSCHHLLPNLLQQTPNWSPCFPPYSPLFLTAESQHEPAGSFKNLYPIMSDSNPCSSSQFLSDKGQIPIITSWPPCDLAPHPHHLLHLLLFLPSFTLPTQWPPCHSFYTSVLIFCPDLCTGCALCRDSSHVANSLTSFKVY